MSEDLGKVSIIVPVYNVEKYLDECILSILNQTYRDIEVLIVDDGSTDESGKKVDDYSLKDDRIKAFHKENGGQALARNLGLKNATGKYICFIDSDDYYEPDFVEKVVNALAGNDADMIFCNYYSCYTDRDVPGSRLREIENGKVFTPDKYLYLLYAFSGVYSYVWNKIYKKEIFEDLEFQQMLCEDAQIMLSVCDRCKKIVFISDVLYHYRRRKSSAVNAKHESMLMGEMRWVEDHMARLKASGRENLFNLAQKLYIRKIFEEYHFCSRKTRKEVIRPLLKKERKQFMRNRSIDAKLRFKYFLVSLVPYLYGKFAFRSEINDKFWD